MDVTFLAMLNQSMSLMQSETLIALGSMLAALASCGVAILTFCVIKRDFKERLLPKFSVQMPSDQLSDEGRFPLWMTNYGDNGIRMSLTVSAKYLSSDSWQAPIHTSVYSGARDALTLQPKGVLQGVIVWNETFPHIADWPDILARIVAGDHLILRIEGAVVPDRNPELRIDIVPVYYQVMLMPTSSASNHGVRRLYAMPIFPNSTS